MKENEEILTDRDLDKFLLNFLYKIYHLIENKETFFFIQETILYKMEYLYDKLHIEGIDSSLISKYFYNLVEEIEKSDNKLQTITHLFLSENKNDNITFNEAE